MIYKPHDYQRAICDFALSQDSAGIFADPGLGKTAATLDYLDRLWWREGYITRALVIAPLRVCYSVWPNEIKKWDNFRHLKCVLLHGPNKETRAASEADLYLLNCENIFWLLENPELLSRFDTLIIDESSKFKNPSSKRFKAIKKHGKFTRVIELTGTPSPKSVLDLYSQIYLLDGGEALGKNITRFKARFGTPASHRGFHEWVPHPWAANTIKKLIEPLVIRLDVGDYLDLPDLIEHEVLVDLPPVARKTYQELERDLFAEIEGVGLLLPSKAVAYGKCRQVANGAVYVEGDSKALHSAKLDAVRDLVDELQGKPVLIAYHYRQDLDVLLKEYPSAEVIGSGVSAKKSDEIAAKWNRGEVPILLGHPQSMAHGLNLQGGGHDLIWYGLTDNLEDYLQMVRRIYRQGVEGNVRVHHVLAADTVDEAIRDRMKSKDNSQRALLNALRSYQKRRNQWDGC